MSAAAFPLPRLETADPAREVARVIARLGTSVHRYASRIASEEPGIIDDLVQEGYIALWITDPTRIGFQTEEQQDYIWRAMRKRMRAAFRRHRRESALRWRPLDRARGLAWRIADEIIGLNGVSQRRKVRSRGLV